MIHKISHRGNTNGRELSRENHPGKLAEVSNSNYVELDVWFENDQYWLGHDKPEYRTTLDFLKNDKFFCHAKNIPALIGMWTNGVHCFWHENDHITFTSKGYAWKYPEVYLDGKLWGICSDWL